MDFRGFGNKGTHISNRNIRNYAAGMLQCCCHRSFRGDHAILHEDESFHKAIVIDPDILRRTVISGKFAILAWTLFGNMLSYT